MTTVNEITSEQLRRLANLRADGRQVLSVYLNLDPAQFATAEARSSEITSVLDGVHREIEEADRPHGELMSLRRDLERVAEFLRGDDSYPQQAHGVAVFASEPLKLFQTLRLPEPVASEWAIAPTPYLSPLAEIGAAGRYCVALVDGRYARILRGTVGDLREVMSIGDDVFSHVQAGGWSQARYQRSQAQEVADHIRHVAGILHRLYRRRPYAMLLIGASEERWGEICDALHPELRERLGERLQIDVQNASVDDVNRLAAEVVERHHAEYEDQQLERLREALGTDGRGAAGLTAVLDALVQQKVQVLLYDAGFSHPGVSCPTCGWLGESGERCPLDDTLLQRWENVLEAAVEAAVRQSADVVPLRERPDLGPLGSIAALLRF